MNLWSGRTWYRKSFTLPQSMQGKKVFANLPASLKGADFVQAAKADRAFSAVDLMELAVPAGVVGGRQAQRKAL